MRCTACGHDNRETAAFCEACGGRLAVVCARCSNELRSGARFCDGCGQAVATPVEPSQTPAPHAHIPRHLAEKILANRAALEGERKQVSVLFADIVGSTELIRDRDPEEAQRLLDGAVRQMMDAVHRYEGTVSRLMGDGLMAMFGAPVAHEDHAVRACYAALAMLEGVRKYADEAHRTHGAAIQIRVGINSGEVVVRLISDDLHMDYTAMGQTVHLASRMEGLANAGTALLSPSTLALAEGFIDVRPLGPTTVKGLEQPVEVFELRGAGMARTRLQAAAARGLTPFVGRQEERAEIERALARVRAGHGQVVALVAEAGVGKSRLVWEAAHSDHTSGFRMLQTGAVSYGQTTAWLPISDLLRTYFHIESRDDHAAMRSKVIGGVQALVPALAPDLPALQSLLDLPADDDAWTALDPPRRRAATLDAVRRLVLRESRERPLLMVFEDLHWIDAETQALLDSLVESLPTARVLLLVNYRPEYSHGWGNKPYYTQLRIDSLRQANADELLDCALGADPTVQPLKGLLVSRTEGNPFFLEESVRSLVEIGALTGERGAYRLTLRPENIRVPATVQAVLAARIDRLPPEEKRLLQTASVIGKDIPFTLLRAVSDLSDSGLQANLSRLQSAELLYAVSLYPEPAYTFKHALTHEVAYGGLLQERRREVHARIVRTIERVYVERLDEQVERLAHHAIAAEDWAGAVRYCEQAGDKAVARAAYREAGLYFERALGALDRVDDKDGRLAEVIDLRLKLRNVAYALGDWRAGLAHLVEAERLAEAIGDRRRLAAISISLGSSLQNLGQTELAFQAAQRALTIAVDLGDAGLRIAATYMLAANRIFVGAYRESAALHRGNLVALSGDLRFQTFGQPGLPSVTTRSNLSWSLAELGEFEEAMTLTGEAVQIAEEADHPYSQTSAHCEAGYPYLLRGDLAGAIRYLERGVHLAELQDNRAYFAIAGARLGYAYAMSGRVEDGLALLRRAVDQFASSGHRGQQAQALTFLAHAHLMNGPAEPATGLAEQALAITQACEQPGRRADALRALGEIAARRDPLDTDVAEGHFQEALAIAHDLGMRPLQAHCRLGLGKLYRRVGRLEEARAELSTAISMLREMGMAFWLPEAERELAEAGR